MTQPVDTIFDLLPAYMRVRDHAEGQRVKGRVAPADIRNAEDFGPLRTLASIVAREGQIVGESIDTLYDNAFIETCAPWVIPYLGDLLGVRGLQDIPNGIDMRARVADTLALRARKGTLRALEHAAADATNWPVLAVEYWKKLVHTQSMRLVHPAMGATVDFRDKPALNRIGTAFERNARNIEVRRIDTAQGRWNLGNIGLHIWRLVPYKLSAHRVFEVAAPRRDFRFHPLECDTQLFDQLGLRGDIDTPMSEDRLPAPISRRIMAEDVTRFYGPDRAILVTVGGAPVPANRVRAANLGDLSTGGAEPGWNHTPAGDAILIDPELGRLSVGVDLVGPVRITCHFARPLDLGGGEQARAATIGSVEDATVLPVTTSLTARINADGGEGTFLLDQSTRYTAGGTITVPDNGVLRIIASDGHFPTVRLSSAFAISLGDGARVELNGLRIYNDLVRITGNGDATVIRDCTLVPGRTLDRSGNATAPGIQSLRINATGSTLLMERCITGPVRLSTDMDARFTECILDAGASNRDALFAQNNSERHVIRLDRCTVRGRVETDAFGDGARDLVQGFGVARDGDDRLATSDTLFASAAPPAVHAVRRQIGCIRFSYVPPGSQTPRLYRCTQGPAPLLASLRYADPDYMLLSRPNGDTLRRGAENGGEIGAYNRAAHTVRADNIRRTIADFLRFGHAAGVFNET